jgi:hypothetical protein
MSEAPRIVILPNPSITTAQACDARARAWAFVFQCWQEKQIAAEPVPEPDGCEGSTLVRSTKEVSHVEQ